ncbi:hypothetical protein JXI42_03690 [bacterium]|nr:hypothetical protein [bacterium]
MRKNLPISFFTIIFFLVLFNSLYSDTLNTSELWINHLVYSKKASITSEKDGKLVELIKEDESGVFTTMPHKFNIDVNNKGLAIATISPGNLMGIEGNSSVKINSQESVYTLDHIRGLIVFQNQGETGKPVITCKVGDCSFNLAGGLYRINQLAEDTVIIMALSGEPISILKQGETTKLQAGEAFYIKTDQVTEIPKKATSMISTWKKDFDYVRELLSGTYIDDEGIELRLPSLVKKEKWFRSRFKGTGGTATYQEEKYNLIGFEYNIYIKKFTLVYDVFFAFDEKNHFRTEDWDEWSDAVNKINFLQYGDRNETVFLKGGNIEKVSFGYGLLTSNYTNSANFPFERKAGLEFKLKLNKYALYLIMNRIWGTTVLGGRVAWDSSDRLRVGLSYMGDINQYVDIGDDDNDSYPDFVDPQPDIKNHRSDSIIVLNDPYSLKSAKYKNIHGVSVDFSQNLIKRKYFKTDIYGELSALSSGGLGLTMPNFYFNFVYFRFGAGLEFQTKRFQSSLFDRYYERDKAVWVMDDDSSLVLMSSRERLNDIDKYLYGWNNRLLFYVPNAFTISSKYRQVERGDDIDKSFFGDIKVKLKKVPYIQDLYFFIEQDHVQDVFALKTNGSGFGFRVNLIPHRSVKVGFRYNQRYEDNNGDGEITDKSETKREYLVRLVVDFNYYYDLLRDYLKKRKQAKEETGEGEFDTD